MTVGEVELACTMKMTTRSWKMRFADDGKVVTFGLRGRQ
jgi:hypothetical protein